MIRMTKISAVLLALMFSAGAMAQSAGTSAGSSMHNNQRPTASPIGSSNVADTPTTHMKKTKMKKASKMKMKDGSSSSTSETPTTTN